MPLHSPHILNADDFGLHPDMDRGIVECVRAGALNSISVVVVHDFDVAALQQLRRDHGTKLGLHVTLVGEPWLTAAPGGRGSRRAFRDDGAADGQGSAGASPSQSNDVPFASWKQLVPRVLVSGALRRAIADEVAAQHARFIERLGFQPDHIDSHQHVHVFPGIWSPCFELAKRLGVRIRTPFAHRANVKRSIAGTALQTLALRCRREAIASGLPAVPCVGLAHAGHNSADVLRRELTCHPSEAVEVVAHPGVNTPALQAKYADWHFDWDAERNALLEVLRDESSHSQSARK